MSSSGQPVTERTALKVATVFACVRIRTGAIANTPLGIKRRVDERTREDASDNPVWTVLNRRPNAWQTPSQFKRMMEAHLLLRGEAYAAKVRGIGGRVIGLIPLHPDRVQKCQRDDNALEFLWTKKNGDQVLFQQQDIFHLVGLSLDGVNGLSVLSYAREAIGLSLAQEQHGGSVFRNGANVTGALTMPQGEYLPEDKLELLRSQMDEYRAGGAREGKIIILEGGLTFKQMALSAEDAQWLESREYGRTDVCMFFGVMPHLAGDTISMGAGAQLMIHNSWGVVVGNQNDFRTAADIFAGFDGSMAEIYEARTGMKRTEIEALMNAETFMGSPPRTIRTADTSSRKRWIVPSHAFSAPSRLFVALPAL
ncbi:phage portal protein [Novosphingobium clariflavum]|uniref:Phage portal protein n=1 Tax=Novosphingobium clariflavum TaxID=2029884 RepID=A0ABV6S5X1_9SPHN|nr:phage portal protein [Novosphingobium clariflavum]